MLKNNKGFTLIEFMIVGTIIGISAAIIIPQYTDYIEVQKTEREKLNRSEIRDQAIMLYGSKYSHKHIIIESSFMADFGYEFKFFYVYKEESKEPIKIKSAEIECNFYGDCNLD